jgi:cobalamin biosynthesis Co2+ chelatase CbiK
MKYFKYRTLWGLLLLLLISACAMGAVSQEKPGYGLLVIAHGSPDSNWNEQVNRLGAQLQQVVSAGEIKGFSHVAVGFLEAEPSIGTAVQNLEKAGAGGIFAVPLFLTTSEHLNRDVPAVLGIYHDRETAEALRKEGMEPVRSGARITLGPPLMYGDFLGAAMTRQVGDLSRESSKEGVVYLCHGSETYRSLWDRMVQQVAGRVAEQTGIASWDYAYVAVGQSFTASGAPVIEKVCAVKPRVLVVSIYLGTSAHELWERAARRDPSLRNALQKRIDEGSLVFGTQTLLPGGRDLLADWVTQRAREYSASLPE